MAKRYDTPEKRAAHAARMREWRSNPVNRAKHNHWSRRYWHSRSRDEKRNRGLKKFGLTVEDYGVMSSEQSDLCAVCSQQEMATRHGAVIPLSVDHNHATGEVRGLLCTKCNAGIGLFMDDPALLRAAAEYLEGFGVMVMAK